MTKQLQIDWFDYWFKPVVVVVSYNGFVDKVRQLEQSKATILSVDVNHNAGSYTITHSPDNETKTTLKNR